MKNIADKEILKKIEEAEKNTLLHDLRTLKHACVDLYNSLNEWLIKALRL